MALFYPDYLFYLVFEWQNKPSNLTIVQEKPVMSIVPPAASVAPPVAPVASPVAPPVAPPVASIAPPAQEIWDPLVIFIISTIRWQLFVGV